jgi:hypothetical protein
VAEAIIFIIFRLKRGPELRSTAVMIDGVGEIGVFGGRLSGWHPEYH